MRLLNSKGFSVFVDYVNIERHSIVYEIGYQNQETLIFTGFERVNASGRVWARCSLMVLVMMYA